MRDRLWGLIGGALALAGAAMLVLWGGTLARTASILGKPEEGMPSDLRLVILAGAVLGLGLLAQTLSLSIARKIRALPVRGKLLFVGAGFLTAMSGAILVISFGAVLGEVFDARGPQAALDAKAIEGVVARGVERATGGFLALLCSQIVLGIGLWRLYWAPRDPRPTGRVSGPLAAATGIAALGFMLALGVAAGIGSWSAGAMSSPSPPDAAALLRAVERIMIYAMLAGGCLVLHGLGQMGEGLVFPKCEHS
ncbi:MAG: hypothetical protein HYS13_02235 [Planctomycetia bacterium]|nr:hypothetical protein [Planctomycetia bacterium]